MRTRWNSTHAMIERACELRKPLSDLAKLRGDLPDLSEEEWKLLDVVAQVLGVFKEASQPLCADSYPTLNKAVQVYNQLFDDFEGFLGQRDDEEDGLEKAAMIDRCGPADKDALTNALRAAHGELCKFYSDTWARMYIISVVLDPRFKMEYFEANNWEPFMMDHAKRAMEWATEEYGTAATQAGQTSIAVCSKFECTHTAKMMKRRRVQKESELARYLRAPLADDDEDILAWWKQHTREYPCLARIARDYLAIPATSDPAERAFSAGANLVSDKRGSLSEETIRSCMCLSNWL